MTLSLVLASLPGLLAALLPLLVLLASPLGILPLLAVLLDLPLRLVSLTALLPPALLLATPLYRLAVRAGVAALLALLTLLVAVLLALLTLLVAVLLALLTLLVAVLLALLLLFLLVSSLTGLLTLHPRILPGAPLLALLSPVLGVLDVLLVLLAPLGSLALLVLLLVLLAPVLLLLVTAALVLVWHVLASPSGLAGLSARAALPLLTAHPAVVRPALLGVLRLPLVHLAAVLLVPVSSLLPLAALLGLLAGGLLDSLLLLLSELVLLVAPLVLLVAPVPLLGLPVLLLGAPGRLRIGVRLGRTLPSLSFLFLGLAAPVAGSVVFGHGWMS